MSTPGSQTVPHIPSVASALDDARAKIVQAWDRTEKLEYLLVDPSLYDAIVQAKQRELDAGRPLRLLGLLLVSSSTLAPGDIEVR